MAEDQQQVLVKQLRDDMSDVKQPPTADDGAKTRDGSAIVSLDLTPVGIVHGGDRRASVVATAVGVDDRSEGSMPMVAAGTAMPKRRRQPSAASVKGDGASPAPARKRRRPAASAETPRPKPDDAEKKTLVAQKDEDGTSAAATGEAKKKKQKKKNAKGSDGGDDADPTSPRPATAEGDDGDRQRGKCRRQPGFAMIKAEEERLLSALDGLNDKKGQREKASGGKTVTSTCGVLLNDLVDFYEDTLASFDRKFSRYIHEDE
jgi:hypothetical protein